VSFGHPAAKARDQLVGVADRGVVITEPQAQLPIFVGEAAATPRASGYEVQRTSSAAGWQASPGVAKRL
jgi:hypothetical protein